MEDLFTSLRPVYYFSKASGIFLYKPVGTAGNRSFVVHKSALIYCLVAILMCLPLVAESFVKDAQEMVLVVISSLQALTNATLVVTNIVCNIYYTRTQVTLLNALVDFDRRANRFGIFINYKQSFRRILFRIAVEVFMVTLFLFIYRGKEWPLYIKILWLVPYFTNKLVKMSVIIHFEAWIILFNERFTALYQNLLEVISNVNLALCAKEYLNHIVVETSDMHLTLSTIAGKVNRIYSIQLLMFVTLNFVLLLVIAYVLCCEIFLHNMTNSEFVTSVFWLFYNAMNMAITCVLCATLIKNANFMKRILHEIPICTMDNNLRRQVSLLSMQLFHDDFLIDAGRFFNVDLSLIYSMIGAVTTYLVIALQFFLESYKGSESNYDNHNVTRFMRHAFN